jgi:hypothetical protein
MPAIINNSLRILAADYFQYNAAKTPLYSYIGGTSQWADENSPPDITDSTEDNIFAYQEMVGGKRVQQGDIISILPRIDWTTSTVYDQYDDKVNIFDEKNPETLEYYKFYVINDEFDVYKCISNNYRTASIVKPSGRSIETFQTADGYIWKFMYNVKSFDAFKFMTPNWIPCYSLSYNDGSSQWAVQASAVNGAINNIDVTDQGTGYTTTNLPTVTIIGDGTGATAVASVDEETGTLIDIIVVNKGQDYTQASVSVSGGDGVGGTAIPYISPVGGHGSNARHELGAIYKMVRVIFDGSENDVLPVDGIDYRKVGLIQSPLNKNTSGIVLTITENENLYLIGDTVTGAASTAQGTVSSIDYTSKLLYLSNVTGSFAQGELVTTSIASSEIQLINLVDNLPLTQSVFNAANDFVPYSGDILYTANREKISRGTNQTEEIRLVLSF